MRNAVEDVLTLAGDHPLIAFWLSLILVLMLLLGGMHVCRVFLRCLILFVREIKHELLAGWNALRDLSKELTRWKSDP